jgi:hypothetical protein
MMRLQAVVVQEVPEEVAGRQSEASLKMRNEDYSFTGFRSWHNLASR